MSISVSNVVVTTDTFESWIDVTNQLCDAMTTRTVTVEANTTGAVTVGNAHVNGRFSANAIIAKDELRGGTVAAPANLTISSNVSIVGANAYISANVYINTGNAWVNTSLLTIQGGSVSVTSNVSIDVANTVTLSPNVVTISSNTLLVTANAVVSGANVVMSVANLSVTSGKLNVSSNVGVTGLTTMYGNVTMSGTLQTITGNVNIESGALFVDSITGYVGVNTTTPDTDLQVIGSANVSSNARIAGVTTLVGNVTMNGALQTIAGNVNIDSGTLFVDSLNNRVGFSNITPDATLSVTGTANVSGASRFGSTLAVVGAATLSNTIATTGAATFANTVGVTGAVTMSSTLNVTGVTTISSNTSISGALHTVAGNVSFDTGTLFVDSVNNRVGFNNTAPDASLTVAGTANVSGNATLGSVLTVVGNVAVDSNTLVIDSTARRVRIGTSNTANLVNKFEVVGNTYIVGNTTIDGRTTQNGLMYVAGDLQVTGNLSYTGTSSGDFIPSSNAYNLGSSTKRWFVYSTGLDVVGNISANGSLSLVNAAVTHTVLGNTNFDSGTLFVDSVNNRVGINNTAPAQALVVTGQANITSDVTIGGTLAVAGNTTHTGIVTNSSNTNCAGVLFVNVPGTKVGVNTITPGAALDVVGTANVSANANFGNTVFIAGNTSIAGGNVALRTDGTVIIAKSAKIANTGMYANVATISTAAANTTIDQFAMSEFGTAKYVIDYRSTSNTQIFGAVEALVISNGTDVYMTEYAAVYSANISFSLDSAVATGTCSLYASAAQGNLSVNISRVSMV